MLKRTRVLILAAVSSTAVCAHGALNVPAFDSYNAPAKLYLDFDGDTTSTWTSAGNTYSPGTTPAYDIDGDPGNFSQQERDNILEICARVAEKYSPFNLDVTTTDPINYTDTNAMRIVIGGNGAWVGQSAGGISNINAFFSTAPNTSFVFPDNLGHGDPHVVAEATTHEAGHAFGLQHQSVFDGTGQKTVEYNPGNASVAPIMGVSYNAARGLWWTGPDSLGADQIQNDLARIGNTSLISNKFGFRPHYFGTSLATAAALPLNPDNSFSVYGVIESQTDADYLSFTTPGGVAHFAVDVAQFGPMLDASLQLFNSSDQSIAQMMTPNLSESLDINLPAGRRRWRGVPAACD